MSLSTFESLSYEMSDRQVSWRGISLMDCGDFDSFMSNDVSSRLYDKEEASQFKSTLRSLATTGFAEKSLEEILAAENFEERDWAVGEALAEAYL